uniref:hypothetical chloroplast RF20 n=1 Tax=Tetraselmis marina TaxID=41888 RepID=UPI0021AD3E4C|nr:hypothetical chloroplast RF20 [Tetraselmis marina]YP_010455909.1 hypothetical chloroplast RF20 [Tetraselmis marina]UUA64576.1 hypothetical chloroplast RF20 [Tetraselmis marina]UUA64585.1 hypothetical chloroplast RF20 [Tetraselmis marina]
MQTQLFKIVTQILFNTKRQFRQFQGQFTVNILYLFIGFITGSTFGTFFLSFIRLFGLWDGVIICFLLVWFEQIGKYVYKSSLYYKETKYLKLINCWKTGLILGFFIDAFKVGS